MIYDGSARTFARILGSSVAFFESCQVPGGNHVELPDERRIGIRDRGAGGHDAWRCPDDFRPALMPEPASSVANDNRRHALLPQPRRASCALDVLSLEIVTLKRRAKHAGYGTLEHMLDLALIEARELEREQAERGYRGF